MAYFLIYAVVGLAYFWAMAVLWSVSAGPSSIATIIEMLISSVMAATAGIWLFNRKAAAVLTIALMAFFVVWTPVTFAVYGVSIEGVVFYAIVLALFAAPVRVLLRPDARVSLPLPKPRLIWYALASLIPLAIAVVLSIGVWEMVFSASFWQDLSSQPDVWGLRSR